MSQVIQVVPVITAVPARLNARYLTPALEVLPAPGILPTPVAAAAWHAAQDPAGAAEDTN